MRIFIFIFKKTLKLFLFNLILSGVVLGFLFLAPDLWAPPLVKKLTNKCSQWVAGQCSISSLRLVHILPLTLRAEMVKIQPENPAHGSIASDALELGVSIANLKKDWHRPRLDFTVQLIKPSFHFLGGEKKDSTEESSPSSGLKIPFLRWPKEVKPQLIIWDASFHLKVQEGELQIQKEAQKYLASDFSLDFEIHSFRQMEYKPKVFLKGLISTQGSSMSVPIQLGAEDLTVNVEGIKVNKSSLIIAGFQSTLDGSYVWVNGDSQFLLKILPTKVNELPEEFKPPGNWKGHFAGEFQAQHRNDLGWQVNGALQSHELTAALDINKNNLKIKGEFKTEWRFRMHYAQEVPGITTGEFQIEEVALNADLSPVSLEYSTWFSKKAGLPLWVDLVGVGTEKKLEIKKGNIRLDHLGLDYSGQINWAKASPEILLNWSLKETSLAGLDRLIPQFQGKTILGSVQSYGEVRGSSLKISDLITKVNSLKLSLNQSEFHWPNKNPAEKTFFGDGKLNLNTELKGQFKGTEVQHILGTGTMDLTNLKLNFSADVDKPKYWPLQLNYQFNFTPEKLQISALKIKTQNSLLSTKGVVVFEKLKWKPQLQLHLNPLDLNETKKIFFADKSFDFKGQGQGQINLIGDYLVEEGFPNSPLALQGKLDFAKLILIKKKIPSPPDDKMAHKKPEDLKNEIQKNLLPTWPLFQLANLDINWQVEKILFEDFYLGTGLIKSQLHESYLDFSGSLNHFLGGRLDIQKTRITPLVSPPGLTLEVKWDHIQANSLLTLISPAQKDLLQGSISGQINAMGPLIPDEKGNLKYSNISISGFGKIDPGEFIPWNLSKKFSEALMGIGLFKGSQNKSSTLGFSGDLNFQTQDGNLLLKRALLLMKNQNLLDLKGQISSQEELTLDGSAHIASLNLGTLIPQSAKDPNGRLVLPLSIRGKLRQPQFVLKNTIQGFIKNALTNEAQQQLNNIKEKAKSQISEELEKGKNKYLDELKKRVQGL